MAYDPNPKSLPLLACHICCKGFTEMQELVAELQAEVPFLPHGSSAMPLIPWTVASLNPNAAGTKATHFNRQKAGVTVQS